MNKFQRIAMPALVAVSVIASVTPAFAKVNEYEGQHRGVVAVSPEPKAADNEYEGQHRGIIVVPQDRKVNEYEGQHNAIKGDPSQWSMGDPSQWGYAVVDGDPSQWSMGDPSQWGFSYIQLSKTAF